MLLSDLEARRGVGLGAVAAFGPRVTQTYSLLLEPTDGTGALWLTYPSGSNHH